MNFEGYDSEFENDEQRIAFFQALNDFKDNINLQDVDLDITTFRAGFLYGLSVVLDERR